MEGLSDTRKQESGGSLDLNRKRGFSPEAVCQSNYSPVTGFGSQLSFQNISHEIDSGNEMENPLDSLLYFIEKLKGYFKLILTQENYQINDVKGISDEEIMEILGIERSDLSTLKNLIGHTEKFLNIIRNPDFISLLSPKKEKDKKGESSVDQYLTR